MNRMARIVRCAGTMWDAGTRRDALAAGSVPSAAVGADGEGELLRAMCHLEWQPRDGERVLEIGPGVGIYSLPIAAALGPSGVLDVVDVQAEMLADVLRRAEQAGVQNIVATHGDAQQLPYPDATFDAAYLISVLGEIPGPTLALGELRRVLKSGGRLIVGEFLIDPDFTSAKRVRKMAARAGFALEQVVGPRWAYFALFRA
jgi:ubiquinone/menaquinone biosynthesis C-methylase UbiE